MWTSIASGPILCQPLAAMLDRVFTDIASNWTPDAAVTRPHSRSFADAFRDITVAFERLSSLREAATAVDHFRPTPLCFGPVSYSEDALHSAEDRAAGFAQPIFTPHGGERGIHTAPSCVPVAGEASELVASINQLTSDAQQLLHSSDAAKVAVGHDLLRRAQGLSVLLARVRQLRVQAHFGACWRGNLC